MIGFYNYSVIVTYIGVALSVSGMALASTGQFKFAILCLALAGACDTFDGKIARAMKNRTKEMEIFGIQIDSLCDMVCFGVTPVIISYQMGLNSVWGIAIEILFVLCGVIRLAYFNVLEELKHTNPETDQAKGYRGLPITTITIIYPIVYLFVADCFTDHFPYPVPELCGSNQAFFLLHEDTVQLLDIQTFFYIREP